MATFLLFSLAGDQQNLDKNWASQAPYHLEQPAAFSPVRLRGTLLFTVVFNIVFSLHFAQSGPHPPSVKVRGPHSHLPLTSTTKLPDNLPPEPVLLQESLKSDPRGNE